MSAMTLVQGGSMFAAVPLALVAGIVAFLSPCVLPLVPGYLGYVSGFTRDDGRRGRMVLGVLLFILGFTVIFVLGSVLVGSAAHFLLEWREALTRIAGVIVILMGLVFIGWFGGAQRTLKPRWQPSTGLGGAPLLGAIFAIGWAPCIGPTLAAVLSLSLDSASASRGAVLGVAYCLGLGIPFLLVALGFGWVSRSVTFFKRHIRAVNLAGGALLVVVGILMVSGLWTALLSHLTGLMFYVPAL